MNRIDRDQPVEIHRPLRQYNFTKEEKHLFRKILGMMRRKCKEEKINLPEDALLYAKLEVAEVEKVLFSYSIHVERKEGREALVGAIGPDGYYIITTSKEKWQYGTRNEDGPRHRGPGEQDPEISPGTDPGAGETAEGDLETEEGPGESPEGPIPEEEVQEASPGS